MSSDFFGSTCSLSLGAHLWQVSTIWGSYGGGAESAPGSQEPQKGSVLIG